MFTIARKTNRVESRTMVIRYKHEREYIYNVLYWTINFVVSTQKLCSNSHRKHAESRSKGMSKVYFYIRP